jgi:hypothetical protein
MRKTSGHLVLGLWFVHALWLAGLQCVSSPKCIAGWHADGWRSAAKPQNAQIFRKESGDHTHLHFFAHSVLILYVRTRMG